MNDPLAKLIAKADSVAESASALVRQSIREIQGEISVMAKELRLGVVAKDREKVEKMILRRMADLSVKLNELMERQNELAAKAAAKSAGRLTGMEVKYDARRAEAITALVTPKQGENLAAVFTDQMGAHAIGALRYATVKVMREQAVQGGGMKATARALEREWLKQAHASENFQFKDAGGHVWDTRTYMQMNVRTNAMRVYNDCLVDNIAQATGGDLARISRGGDPNCTLCGPWEGVIVSISGKTKGLPTYEQALEAGCFHPNCVHTLEYVDEIADEEEIELQKAHPVNTEEEAADPDAADERKYAIDQDRYRKAGMSSEEARVAVDRDNLAASIRHGLIRDDAREIVDRMTDAQVTALCPNGNPPTFEPTKGTKKNPEPERWNHGSRGGVFHVKRNASAEHILELLDADKAKQETRKATGMTKADKWKARAMQSAVEAEREIERVQIEEAKANAEKYGYPPITTRHTEEDDARAVNQNFKTRACEWTHNCQRCVVAYEMRRRGLDVVARPKPEKDTVPHWLAFKGPEQINIRPRTPDENVYDAYRREIAGNSDPVGTRYIVYLKWNERLSHVVIAEKTAGGFLTIDPQNGEIRTSEKDNRAFMGIAENTRMNYQRIDNAEIIRRVADQCVAARRR